MKDINNMNGEDVENNDDPFAILRPSKEPAQIDEKALEKKKKRKSVYKKILFGLLIVVCAYIVLVPAGLKLFLGTAITRSYRMKIELSRYDHVESTIVFCVDGNYVRISEGDYVNSFSSDLYWSIKDDKIYVWGGYYTYPNHKVQYRRVDVTKTVLGRPTVSTDKYKNDIFSTAVLLRPTNGNNADVIEDFKLVHLFGKYIITGKMTVDNKRYDVKITLDRIGFTNVPLPWDKDDYK